MAKTKICRVCHKEQPATFDFFRENTMSAGGALRAVCRQCNNNRKRERHAHEVSEKKRNTILVISDAHHPEHDRKVWATTLELAKDIKPGEVILLGDFLEMSSVSQHGGAELEKLTEDFAAGKQALRQIREAVGEDCRITYLEGNHESRLTRFLMSKAPSLRDSLSYQIGLEMDSLGVEWVPEFKQPVTRGDIDFTHGHQDLRERPSKYHTGKMAEIYGRPERTVIYGHTHKPQIFTRPTVGGHATAIGLGCSRTLSPGWLHGAQAGWVHQIAVVYLSGAGRSYVYPITFKHGQTMWSGKFYGAVTAE